MIGIRMLGIRFWRTAAKLALRDIRRSPAASAFTAITMAASIASIAGVNGVTAVARDALGQDARTWLGADVAVDTGEPISEDQTAALDRMRDSGADWTMTIMALTAVSSKNVADPGYIGVKVIDPAKYPFYGTSEPQQTVAQVLTDETVAVSENVLTRMQVRVGDSLRVGSVSFRISTVFPSDQDRFMGVLGMGMRCILSQRGYERTGIARGGNSVKYRILLRLPAEASLASATKQLQELFPEGLVADYRDANLQTAANTENAISFLGVIAFLTLGFSSMGVAIASRHHVEQRMSTMAVMKAVGARGSQLAGVLLVEISCFLLAAVIIGMPLGFALRVSMISVARKFVVLSGSPAWHIAVILQSAGVAALAMIPLLVRPALAIRTLRPAIVLRRDTGETSLPRVSRGMSAGALAVAALAFLAVVFGLIGSWRWAVVLVSALAGSVGIAVLLAAACLALIKRAVRWAPMRRLPALRLGLASLGRPGNRSRVLVVSLAVGVMLMVSTFDSSRSVLKAVIANLPYGRSSIFIAGFEDSHAAGLRAFLESLPGVESVDIKTQARLRLRAVDGTPIEELQKRRSATGSWYVAECDSGSPREPKETRRMSIGDDLAVRLGVRAGSRLEFSSRDEAVSAEVAEVRKLTPGEKYWFTVSLDCSGLSGPTVFHSAEIQARPERIAEVLSATGGRYPTLPLITAEDIRETILGIANDAAEMTRLVTWYTLAAGISVLIAVVASSRAARLREIGILSALGAGRKAMVRIYTIEFAAIGVLAGLIGAGLAFGFTSVVVSAIFRRPEVSSEWRGVPLALLAATVGTVAAGWLPAYRLLRRTPMEVLRDE